MRLSTNAFLAGGAAATSGVVPVAGAAEPDVDGTSPFALARASAPTPSGPASPKLTDACATLSNEDVTIWRISSELFKLRTEFDVPSSAPFDWLPK